MKQIVIIQKETTIVVIFHVSLVAYIERTRLVSENLIGKCFARLVVLALTVAIEAVHVELLEADGAFIDVSTCE